MIDEILFSHPEIIKAALKCLTEMINQQFKPTNVVYEDQL